MLSLKQQLSKLLSDKHIDVLPTWFVFLQPIRTEPATQIQHIFDRFLEK